MTITTTTTDESNMTYVCPKPFSFNRCKLLKAIMLLFAFTALTGYAADIPYTETHRSIKDGRTLVDVVISPDNRNDVDLTRLAKQVSKKNAAEANLQVYFYTSLQAAKLAESDTKLRDRSDAERELYDKNFAAVYGRNVASKGQPANDQLIIRAATKTGAFRETKTIRF